MEGAMGLNLMQSTAENADSCGECESALIVLRELQDKAYRMLLMLH